MDGAQALRWQGLDINTFLTAIKDDFRINDYAGSKAATLAPFPNATNEGGALSMGTRLFVANFPTFIDESQLQDLFEHYGNVEEVRIWVDFETGEKKEWGFVEMKDEYGAERAIMALNGRRWHERRLKVSEARPRISG